jgi:hypothetical protein
MDIIDIYALLPEAARDEMTQGGCNRQAVDYWVDNILNIDISRHDAEQICLDMDMTEDELEDMTEFEIIKCAVWYASQYEG